MKTTGTIKDLARALTGETLITLKVDLKPELLEELIKEELLDIDIDKHREKRSLNANSYYHALCGELAKKLNSSMTEICNHMIAEYGYIDHENGPVIFRADVPWERLDMIHLRPTTKIQEMADGKLYRCFYVMRGSHTYNTKEMKHLLDGVISECEEQGIPTITQEQEQKLLERWEKLM